MKPPKFDYHVPSDPHETVALLADLGDEAKIIAGGQSLVPMLNVRLSFPEHLVDLRHVGLRGVQRRDEAFWIGACTTQRAIERSGEVAAAVPLLARATGLIGHFQIRNRGTIGGSLAHADPAAEYPAVALALGAELETLSPRGPRSVPATSFFTGRWTTELAADEVLTGIAFPPWTGRCGFAIEEFARRSGDFALAGAAVALALDGSGRVERCGIALFGLGSVPMRAWSAETALIGSGLDDIGDEEIGRLAVAGLDGVPADLHGSAEYRRQVGVVVVARAWQRAAQEARNA